MTTQKTTLEEIVGKRAQEWVNKKVRNNTLYGLLILLIAVLCFVSTVALHHDGPQIMTPITSIVSGVIAFLLLWSVVTALFRNKVRLSRDYVREQLKIVDHHINTLNGQMNNNPSNINKVIIESQLIIATSMKNSLLMKLKQNNDHKEPVRAANDDVDHYDGEMDSWGAEARCSIADDKR